MGLIILPQALEIVIPGIVNTLIGLFKDTTLVLIIGLFDLLGIVQAALTDAVLARLRDSKGYVFAAFGFWIFCFGMSRYACHVERRLHTGHSARDDHGMAVAPGRRADDRAARRAQVVRPVPRAQGHQPRRLEGPAASWSAGRRARASRP